MQCGPTLSVLSSFFNPEQVQYGLACNMGMDKVTLTYKYNQTITDTPADHRVSAWCDSGVASGLRGSSRRSAILIRSSMGWE